MLTGIGKTKQLAKREAARRMFDQVKNVLEEEIAVEPFLHLTQSNFLQNNDKLKYDRKGNLPLSSSNFLKDVEIFNNQLKLSRNPSINYLMVIHFTWYNCKEYM